MEQQRLLHDDAKPSYRDRSSFGTQEQEGLEAAEQEEREEEEQAWETDPIALEVEEQLAALARRGPTFGLGFLITLWNLSAPFLAMLMCYYLSASEWPFALCCAFLLATVGKLNGLVNRMENTQTAFEVADDDLQKIGPLAEALEWQDSRTRAIAGKLLIRLLHRVKEGDAVPLTGEQRRTLYDRLTSSTAFSEPDLVVAILKALPAFGDEGAVPLVERLMTGIAWTSGLRRVRAAAQERLPLLEESIERRIQEAMAAAQEQGAVAVPVSGEETETVEEGEAARLKRGMTKFERELEELRKHGPPGMRWPFLVASWCIIFPYTGFQFLAALSQGLWLEAGIWGTLAFLTTQMHRFTLTMQMKMAAEKLATHADKEAVGALTEALDWPDAEIREIVGPALRRVLPHLNASDTNLLNKRQRAILNRMLQMGNARSHSGLMIAILKAYEQVGTHEAIPFVERLANGSAFGRRQQEVQQFAQECLPYLNSRAGNNRYAQELLRASSAAEIGVPSETLLRPVVEVRQTAPEELLRPTQKE